MKRAGPKMPARRMLSFSNLFSSIRSSRRGDGRGPNADDREPYSRMRHATADFTEADDDDESNEESNHDEEEDEEEDDDEEDDNNRRDSGTVLPLFSESHLDALPVYSITHAIRIIVQTRTETALTWDQLRSPQVSQFLVVSALQTQPPVRSSLLGGPVRGWLLGRGVWNTTLIRAETFCSTSEKFWHLWH